MVIASAAGAPRNPAWFHNVRTNPSVPGQAERDALWSKVIKAMPGYADYQKQTDRVIPVVVLTR